MYFDGLDQFNLNPDTHVLYKVHGTDVLSEFL